MAQKVKNFREVNGREDPAVQGYRSSGYGVLESAMSQWFQNSRGVIHWTGKCSGLGVVMLQMLLLRRFFSAIVFQCIDIIVFLISKSQLLS